MKNVWKRRQLVSVPNSPFMKNVYTLYARYSNALLECRSLKSQAYI